MTRKTSADDRECWICGTTLDERWRADAVFCTEPCKDAAYRIRRKLRDQAKGHTPSARWRRLLANPRDPEWRDLFAVGREEAARLKESRFGG